MYSLAFFVSNSTTTCVGIQFPFSLSQPGGAVLDVEVGPDCDNHVVPLGGCLRLTCSSSPRGPVQWSRLDGQEIQRKPNTCSTGDQTISQCSQGGGGDGVLIVEDVHNEDAGYYLCTARFQNFTRSQVCHVVIGSK